MKKLSTFPMGGVHPHDNKEYSNTIEIRDAEIPDTLVIALSQHLGKPANSLVNAGDSVTEGMLIAEADGFISANIHCPVDGTVKEISEISLPNGARTGTIVIEKKEGFTPKKYTKKNDWKKTEAKDLLDTVLKSGIVGLGGATFPSNVKLSIPRGKKAEALIINGVECEPYLTADHRLMLEKTSEILEGIQIIRKILGCDTAYIGIEKNKPDAITRFSEASADDSSLTVQPLKMKYPQGDEKQLIKAIMNREVPSGGLPIDIGAVVLNVGTVFAIYEAVCLGKPLYERIVTLSGKGIANPANLRVKTGTPVSALVDACGGTLSSTVKLVSGGPMMGFSFYNLETPVTKGTSGILCLTEKEINSANSTSCIKCGRCIGVCPMGLNPTRMFKMIEHHNIQEAMDAGLMDCKECGCCSYTCPAHIPLVQGMRTGKRLSRKMR